MFDVEDGQKMDTAIMKWVCSKVFKRLCTAELDSSCTTGTVVAGTASATMSATAVGSAAAGSAAGGPALAVAGRRCRCKAPPRMVNVNDYIFVPADAIADTLFLVCAL
jgi:hypothetical protein